ncbi:MAG: arsenate reductase (glutaredoxin) [Pseudomonadota bacterium]
MPTIYHNPRCSKSRNTLALLESKGITPDIVLYLDTPPDKTELKSIVAKLGLGVRDIIRTGEALYQHLSLKDDSLSDEQLLEAIAEHPKLLQRPIVVDGKHAIIGRPPEKVLDLI